MVIPFADSYKAVQGVCMVRINGRIFFWGGEAIVLKVKKKKSKPYEKLGAVVKLQPLFSSTSILFHY